MEIIERENRKSHGKRVVFFLLFRIMQVLLVSLSQGRITNQGPTVENLPPSPDSCPQSVNLQGSRDWKEK